MYAVITKQKFRFLCFDGISTFEGYSMPNPSLLKKITGTI